MAEKYEEVPQHLVYAFFCCRQLADFVRQQLAILSICKTVISQLSVGTWGGRMVPYDLLDLVTYLVMRICLLLIQ